MTSIPPPPALCEMRDVTQVFAMPDGTPRTVLDNVSVEVRPHEVVALLGPSGCGKSTILRILAGLITPTKGEVSYHNDKLVGLNPGVAMVFQSFALYPWMTVTQNVSIVLEAAGLDAQDRAAQIKRVLAMVGLSGFEEAYPRELSGGMKQRVGMARALATEPEMLFMDEPFSQVDALTAESLRAEVLDIFGREGQKTSSIMMVSHDIKEVAFMADRIVVLGANPGVVRSIFDNRLRRPRDYRSPAMLRLVDRLHDIIMGHEMPDEEPASTQTKKEAPDDAFEPLPAVPPSEVVGLLEYLDARGGSVDVFQIAADTHQEFGRVIAVVKAAELLDLVDTPKRLVVMLPAAEKFVAMSGEAQKVAWRERLLTLKLFRRVKSMLALRKKMSKKVLAKALQVWFPSESQEQLFTTFVAWARFGDLFAYDEDTETLSP